MESDECQNVDHGKVYNWFIETDSKVGSKIPKNINWNIALVVLFFALLSLNFARLFYNNFWWDECYSISTAHLSINEIIDATIKIDSNPPFYYIILKGFCSVLGYQPFVYGFTSFFPYLVIMILSITVVRKRFGIAPAAMVMLFASILEQPQYYITEVRSYEWALLFIFIMFILTYEIIKNLKIWHFVIITATYICASYTHYYALMCGGLMIAAIIMMAVKKKDRRLFCLSSLSLVASIIAYTPWIPHFFVQVSDATTDFWISYTPTVFDCIFMFFGFNPVFLVFIFFLVVTAIFLLRRFAIIKKGDDFLSLFHTDSDRWWFIIIGLFSIFGVIIFMAVVSYIRHPVLLLRYVYTFAIVAWLITGVFVSGAKPKRLLTVTIISLTLLSIPWCCGWMYLEYQHNAEINDTVSYVYPYMEEDDDILTDIWGFTQLESEYYYPGIPSTYIKSLDELDDLPVNDHHWLFMKHELNDDEKNKLHEKGYDQELIRKGMVPHDINVWIYRLHPTVSV